MIRIFHRFLGWALLAVYLYLLFHRSALLPGLSVPAEAAPSFSKALGGYALAYALPVASIICFLWPERLMRAFSPRIQPDFDYLLTEGVWYALGYAFLLGSIGALLLFHQA